MATKAVHRADPTFSETWLKSYASRHADTIEARRQDSPQDVSNLEAVLHELDDTQETPTTPGATDEQTPEEKAAPKDISKEPNKEKRDELARQKEQRAKEQAQARKIEADRKARRNFTDSVQENVIAPFTENITNTAEQIGSIQTVGGIGLLVVILIALLFVVVRVNANGDTRLKQLWYMLNGRAKLANTVDAVTGSTAAGGATGATGTTGTTTTQPITPVVPTNPVQPNPVTPLSFSAYRQFGSF